MNQPEQIIPEKRVLKIFTGMMLLPTLYGLMGGHIVIVMLFFIIFPAGLFGHLSYINKPAFDEITQSGGHIFLGWMIYFLLLAIGLRFRSEQAHRRWLIACAIIFLLTWAGCGPIGDVSGPCANGC